MAALPPALYHVPVGAGLGALNLRHVSAGVMYCSAECEGRSACGDGAQAPDRAPPHHPLRPDRLPRLVRPTRDHVPLTEPTCSVSLADLRCCGRALPFHFFRVLSDCARFCGEEYAHLFVEGSGLHESHLTSNLCIVERAEQLQAQRRALYSRIAGGKRKAGTCAAR